LKQTNGKLKGDIWLLACLIKPCVESSQKRDLYARWTSELSNILNLN